MRFAPPFPSPSAAGRPAPSLLLLLVACSGLTACRLAPLYAEDAPEPLSQGFVVEQALADQEDLVRTVAYRPDGTLVFGTTQGELALWHPETGERGPSFTLPDSGCGP